MKKLFFALLILISHTALTQDNNSKNEINLTEYFKEKIPEKLLKNITFPKSNPNLELSFYVNKENIPFRTWVNYTRNTKLNKALIKAFEEYPLENFNIKFDTRKKYSFRVITKERNQNIIDCSSSLVETEAPNCESCKDLDFYTDIEKCISKKLRNHFYSKINFSLSNNVASEDEKIKLNIKLFIDQNGFLKLKKLKVPVEFEEHIKDIIQKYPVIFNPKTIDNNSVSYDYSFSLSFKKGDTPKNKELNNYYDSIFKPTTENDFAHYLSKNLTEEDINNANLNRLNDRLSIYFELDKKDNPVEITTTARSKKLEEKVISLFNKFDFTNLNFLNKHKFNRYFTSIIIFENGVNSIKTNSIIGYSRAPIIAGCKKSKNVKAARKCFSRQVQIYFSKKFNAKLPNRLGLSPGRKRVFIGFKINKRGKIEDIKVRAPHKKIKEEVIRVMKKLPKSTPPIFGNELVDIRYAIPFTLIVE